MKKKYEFDINRHTADFCKKRAIFIAGNVFLSINLVVFSILLPEIRAAFLGLAAIFVIHAVVVAFFEKRAKEWTWPAVLSNVLLFPVLSFGLLWFVPQKLTLLLLFLTECLIFTGLLVFLFRSHFCKK